MGKRKSSKKPQGPKKKETMPKNFTCLFCNHENSVEIKMEKKMGCGMLSCRICGQRFQCQINYLSAPIDVYCEWVDAAEAVAEETRQNGGKSGTQQRESRGLYQEEEEPDDYEGEGVVVDDEPLD